jgi:hypothetical protein
MTARSGRGAAERDMVVEGRAATAKKNDFFLKICCLLKIFFIHLPLTKIEDINFYLCYQVK